MKLIEHPLWPDLARRLRVQTYDRDGGHTHPRHRIELDTRGIEPNWLGRFLGIEVACATCGRPIRPLRQRRTKSLSVCANVSCELKVNYGCARGKAATAAYQEIVDALAHQPPHETQPSLFDE